jgi:hypothetical protein
MEAAVLWKAAMRPRLPAGLGKRRKENTDVFHSSHSPCCQKKTETREEQSGRPQQAKTEPEPEAIWLSLIITKCNGGCRFTVKEVPGCSDLAGCGDGTFRPTLASCTVLVL